MPVITGNTLPLPRPIPSRAQFVGTWQQTFPGPPSGPAFCARLPPTQHQDQLTKSMNTKLTLQIILGAAVLSAALISSGCAGPAARHEARVDRRSDRVENRWDRRYDRQERIENRYSY